MFSRSLRAARDAPSRVWRWRPCSAAPQAMAADVTVFAAASLKNALDDINAAWKAEAGKEATISYAASSALAKQIEEGAPADVFVSADVPWMDYLVERDLVKKDTRRRPSRQPPRPRRAGRLGRHRRDRPGLRPRRRARRRAARHGAGQLGAGRQVRQGGADQARRLGCGRRATSRRPRTSAPRWRSSPRGEAPFGIVYADRRQRREGGQGRRHIPRGQPRADRLSCRDHRRGEERRRRGLPGVPRSRRRRRRSSRSRASRSSRPCRRTERRARADGVAAAQPGRMDRRPPLPPGLDLGDAGQPALRHRRRLAAGAARVPGQGAGRRPRPPAADPAAGRHRLPPAADHGPARPGRRLPRPALRHRLRLPLDRRGARLRGHGLPAARARHPPVDRGGRPPARGGGRRRSAPARLWSS